MGLLLADPIRAIHGGMAASVLILFAVQPVCRCDACASCVLNAGLARHRDRQCTDFLLPAWQDALRGHKRSACGHAYIACTERFIATFSSHALKKRSAACLKWLKLTHILGSNRAPTARCCTADHITYTCGSEPSTRHESWRALGLY